ncbi:hypothetical protein CFAM422_011284 [Trichoderma lentiforme]|uniref:Uncharacterized protein n=1 Tax=Trichoderma lentiforme TaxID=1567552 RepID=A0A9P4X794_9HYPO|nr:hypothetical protein CFAM422_011284 [Trichoderma lentiforme]
MVGGPFSRKHGNGNKGSAHGKRSTKGTQRPIPVFASSLLLVTVYGRARFSARRTQNPSPTIVVAWTWDRQHG